MYNKEEELEVMENVYNNLDSELKKIYEEQKNDKEELLKELALLLLFYSIVNNALKVDKARSIVVSKRTVIKITDFITKESNNQIKITSDLINNTKLRLESFYKYKVKDVENVIKRTIEGKTYDERIWKNNKKISEFLKKQAIDFINGSITIEQMKNNVEKAFKSSKYNAERLVEDTISRVRADIFERYCKENNIKKVRRIATLDGSTCTRCKEEDGEVYKFNDPNRPYLPEHVKCRCYYTVEE